MWSFGARAAWEPYIEAVLATQRQAPNDLTPTVTTSVARRGFEPLTSSLKGKRPGPLGDRAGLSTQGYGRSQRQIVTIAAIRTCTRRLWALFRIQRPYGFFSNEIYAAVTLAMKPSQASAPSMIPSVIDFPPRFNESSASTDAFTSDATTPTAIPAGPGLPSCACVVPRYAIQRLPKTGANTR